MAAPMVIPHLNQDSHAGYILDASVKIESGLKYSSNPCIRIPTIVIIPKMIFSLALNFMYFLCYALTNWLRNWQKSRRFASTFSAT